MASFLPPPHTRPPFVELPNGDYQVDQMWHDFFLQLASVLSKGANTTVPLAKLTGGGANGQLVITNGIITSVTAPT